MSPRRIERVGRILLYVSDFYTFRVAAGLDV